MTYKDKGSYESLPPCMTIPMHINQAGLQPQLTQHLYEYIFLRVSFDARQRTRHRT